MDDDKNNYNNNCANNNGSVDGNSGCSQNLKTNFIYGDYSVVIL